MPTHQERCPELKEAPGLAGSGQGKDHLCLLCLRNRGGRICYWARSRVTEKAEFKVLVWSVRRVELLSTGMGRMWEEKICRVRRAGLRSQKCQVQDAY